MAQTDLCFTFDLLSSGEETEESNSSLQLDVLSFRLEEGLNTSYALDVELVSFDSTIDGLVGRSLTKKLDEKDPDLIRGVIHNVQPCDGSATLYTRMKAGWEGLAGIGLGLTGDELIDPAR